MKELKFFINKTPRIVRNLFLFPGIFFTSILSTIFLDFAGILPTIIHISLSLEGLFRLAIDSQSNIDKSDFRYLWIQYNFRIRYYFFICICYLLAMIFKPFIGYYFLIFYLIIFGVFRLYGYEAAELVKRNTEKVKSTTIISNYNSGVLNNDYNTVSPDRHSNLERFLLILKEISPTNYSSLVDKATFSSWFGSRESDLIITELESKLKDGSEECNALLEEVYKKL